MYVEKRQIETKSNKTNKNKIKSTCKKRQLQLVKQEVKELAVGEEKANTDVRTSRAKTKSPVKEICF